MEPNANIFVEQLGQLLSGQKLILERLSAIEKCMRTNECVSVETSNPLKKKRIDLNSALQQISPMPNIDLTTAFMSLESEPAASSDATRPLDCVAEALVQSGIHSDDCATAAPEQFVFPTNGDILDTDECTLKDVDIYAEEQLTELASWLAAEIEETPVAVPVAQSPSKIGERLQQFDLRDKLITNLLPFLEPPRSSLEKMSPVKSAYFKMKMHEWDITTSKNARQNSRKIINWGIAEGVWDDDYKPMGSRVDFEEYFYNKIRAFVKK